MESYYYRLGIIVSILLIIGVIWFIISLFIVKSYEGKINKLHLELENEINNIKKQSILQSIAEGRMKAIREDYDEKIKGLERNRKFILDKLPFIK